jgi:hypothetical protein
MKTTVLSSKRPARGYALLMVLCIAACCMVLMTATMWRQATDSDLTARNNQYNAGICAAEASTEKVLSRMRYDYVAGQGSLIAANLSYYRTNVPTTAENSYWANFQFSDGAGHLNQTWVSNTSTTTYQPLEYYGLSGWVTMYRILSNVQQTTRANFTITNALQQDVQLEAVPVFQFAIFFNSLLEFTWAAPLVVNGRVHANGNIYYGSSSPLTLSQTATCSGVMMETNWGGYTVSQFSGVNTFNGVPAYVTNTPVLELPIGTNNSPAAVQQIIMPPPAGESPTSPMGEQRYYNKAEVVMLVSNATVTAIVQNTVNNSVYTNLSVSYNAATTNYSAVTNNFPFLTLTNYFSDQRESKIVKVSQIDIGKLNQWLLTSPTITGYYPPSGSGSYPNIMYFGDFRTDAGTTNGSEMVGVRLTNGVAVPTNGQTGFTLATPDPLYVWGNYNTPTSANQGTTNVSGTMPASLISDALTILSSAWQDHASSNSIGSSGSGVRDAATTTVDAALIAGIVYSIAPANSTPPSQFSGGVVNYPRLLENWSSVSLWLNTSIINMYPSMIATNQWQTPGTYYYAPTREFNFNQNYLTQSQQPPGSPMFGLVQKAKWTIPPPNNVAYYGY